MKDTKDSELLHFSSLNFVIFATFVVKFPVSFLVAASPH